MGTLVMISNGQPQWEKTATMSATEFDLDLPFKTIVIDTERNLETDSEPADESG